MRGVREGPPESVSDYARFRKGVRKGGGAKD